MLKRWQNFYLTVFLSQAILGISWLFPPKAIADPDSQTSPKQLLLEDSSSSQPIEGKIEENREITEVATTNIVDRTVSLSAMDLIMPMNADLPAIIAQTESPSSSPNPEDSIKDKSAPTNTENLSKAAQNPIASLISVPFQYNFNFGAGPFDRTQYLLNIQPVIPTSLNEDWTLVSRIITPILIQPTRIESSTFGLGDINPSFFFVPKSSSNLTWGIGPVASIPTATDRSLGTGKLSLGPTAVIVWTPDTWVIGALANQVWSVAGDSSRPDVSQFLFQPFINYNFPDGWYVTSSPVITANWIASSGNQWTLPIGGGFGRVFRLDRQPVNVSLAAFWNVIRPEFAADWQIRFQFQLLFPTGG